MIKKIELVCMCKRESACLENELGGCTYLGICAPFKDKLLSNGYASHMGARFVIDPVVLG